MTLDSVFLDEENTIEEYGEDMSPKEFRLGHIDETRGEEEI